MRRSIKTLLQRGLGPLYPVLRNRLLRLGVRCFSQEGEDRVLARFFEKQAGGFYVDVGAHHPFRFSNTFLFYRQGWHGININLEVGVARQAGTAQFHVFGETALNTFDPALAAERNRPPHPLLRVVDVPLRPLGALLREKLPQNQHIDFMSVDVEGLDLEVLMSNDWDIFRPRLVLAETFGKTMEDLPSEPVAKFMKSVGYVLFAKTVHTSFFLDERQL
jgi:hypothetical protein